MSNFSGKKLFFVVSGFLLGMFLFLGNSAFSFLIKPVVIEVVPSSAQISSQIAKNFPTSPFLILVGDIMLNRQVEYRIRTTGDGDFKFPFSKISETLKEANLVFGNLEGPISDKGQKVGSIYSFRNNPKAIEGLIFAGFDVLSLANNHAFDYGQEALTDTFLRLEKAGIDYVGAGLNSEKAFGPTIKEINGLKIGYLAYTNLGPKTWRAGKNNPGLAWVNENSFSELKKNISLARAKTDILIVSLHAGEEYIQEPSQFQIDFSHLAIDAGADIIIGHHPHIVQRNEEYNGGYIFYSLGNFVFDQSFSEKTMRGEIVKVIVENGKIKEVIPVNIKINEFFQPEFDKLNLNQ